MFNSDAKHLQVLFLRVSEVIIMTEEKTDLLAQYHNITHKLKKKRILKKPNLAEASQQFEQLGISFERENLPQYTGLCYQAAAKCQNSLGNTLEEGLLLLKASRQFMSGFLENINDKNIPNQSFLNHSYMYYKDCLERLNECEEPNKIIKNALMGCVVFEMADNLEAKANLPIEGFREYKKALELFSDSPLEKINCLQKLISLKIESGDYSECLEFANELIEELKCLYDGGFRDSMFCSTEITRIFLLLILKPTLQQITPHMAEVLEKYAWVDTSSSKNMKDLSSTLKKHGLSMLEDDLFLKLKSLVMACQYCDTEGLELLEKDLIVHLNHEQKFLLRTLIKQYTIEKV